MKVSVLIPAFHAERFIGTALLSVRAQQHADWELIVVEDGSRDETEQIVLRFAASSRQRCVYDNLGTNRGVSAARNRLIKLAKGDVLAFLDADDTWASGHLSALVAQIQAGCEIVVSGVRTIDVVQNSAREFVAAPAELVTDPVMTLFRRSAIITSSAVGLTRELADRVGWFDLTLRIGEDRDYWLRCALANARFGLTKSFTCDYAKHAGSAMARTQLVAQQEARFYEKYRSLTAIPARLRRHLLAESLIAHGRLLRAESRQRSAACFWQAWRCEPLNFRTLLHLAFTGWQSVRTSSAA